MAFKFYANNICPVCGKPRGGGGKRINHEACSRYSQKHGNPAKPSSQSKQKQWSNKQVDGFIKLVGE